MSVCRDASFPYSLFPGMDTHLSRERKATMSGDSLAGYSFRPQGSNSPPTNIHVSRSERRPCRTNYKIDLVSSNNVDDRLSLRISLATKNLTTHPCNSLVPGLRLSPGCVVRMAASR